MNPCFFSQSKENADLLREFFQEAIALCNKKANYKNHLLLERNEYVIAAVMDESINDEPLVLEGLFADMYSPDFAICNSKTVPVGENTLLLDFAKIKEELCVIGTSLRVLSLNETNDRITAEVQGASGFEANIRIKVPFEITKATVDDTDCFCEYHEESKTVLIKFQSCIGKRTVVLS